MMFYTHLAFAFVVGLFSMQLLHPGNQILFIILLLFASALPDIDSPKSKLGKKIKIIGYLFEHRGFFHSLFAAVLFGFITQILLKSTVYTYAVIIGYASHLAIDALTVQGVMPFHPISKKAIRGFIETGKAAEMVIFLLLFLAGVYKLIHL